MANTIDLLDDEKVCEVMRILVDACDWDALNALSVEHACAKQRKALTDAEARYLASLPEAQRTQLIAVGRVNLGD